MNQRPFISTQLSIFDENRCVFSPSMIAGQPVMISQEQNRKICDSLTTAIASNQPRHNTSCFCACSPSVYPNQQQIWSCPLQAQKQGIPGGVAFNFSQPNYCCPPSCLPSVYNPPPPPCPQVVDCPHKTPQSICVDFGKFGMEALAFQQKCRQQCQGFTYDKQVGTSDQVIFPKCNTCCCGVQSVTLNAEQKEELFHKLDETDSKSKLKICSCDPVQKKRCCCFPKPDPNKFGSAKNLVIGERKERSCKDYDIVEQATREADAEAYLCCNCLDKWKKENENRRPSCLKKRCECFTEKQKENKDVSFCFRGNTLEITEENKARPKTEEQPIDQSKIESKHPSCLSDEAKSEIVKQINEMKRKRKGIVKMAQDFRITAKDYIEQLDRDIDHYRELYKSTKNEKKENFIQRYRCDHLFDNTELETAEEKEEEKSKKWIRNIRAAAKTKKEDNEIQQLRDSFQKQLLHGTGKEEKVIKIIPPDNEQNETGALKSDEKKSALITEPKIEPPNPGNPESKLYDERTKSNPTSEEEQPSFDASSKNVENDSITEKTESNSEDPNANQIRQAENEKTEEISSPQIESGQVGSPSIVQEPNDSAKSNLKAGTSQGGKADISSDVTYDDDIQNHFKNTNFDEIQMEEEIASVEATSLESEQAVVGESAKMNNASQNSTVQTSPKSETITEESNTYEEQKLDLQEEPFDACTKSGNPETIIIKDEKSEPNKFSEDENKVTEQQSVKKPKVCGGSCAIYRENKNIDEGIIVESQLDNNEENDEFSNRNKSEVKQNYNEITEDNISDNKHASTSKKNEAKHPLDHVSFSAQQSASDENIVLNKEEQSTSDPQMSDDGKRGNYCNENSACRKIIQYMYDQNDDEPTRNGCDIREIYEFCNCCRCDAHDGICFQESKNLVFKPCIGERNTTNGVRNILSNIYSSAIEKAGNLVSFITNFRSPCPRSKSYYENPHILTDRYGCGAGCYARRIKRHFASLNMPRNVCPCRMDTNRFCGKTCYDYDKNRWYSCCEGFDDGHQKVVKITFKETAERRTVRLENNCRNSRYHVVYE